MRTTDNRLDGLNLTEDGVLDLSGEYDGGPLPEHVVAAVEASLDRGETHYTTRPGLPALAQAVAKKLGREQGLDLDPSLGVVISTGGRESLFAAIQVLARPGDEVLVPALRPAYIDADIRLAQAVLVPVPQVYETGFQIKAAAIQACLTHKSRLLLLSNPANPTGVVIPRDEMAAIAALAEAHDLTVISDESLDESLDFKACHSSIASFPEAARRTLIVGSFSRLHDLASWRVGFFAGPKEIAQPVRDLKQAMTICTSAVAQYAALAALTGPHDWLARRRAEIDQKRAFVLAALNRMGFPHSNPSAAPYVWVDTRSAGRSSGEFASWLLAQARVAVTPGSRFGPQGEGYVRLSLWPSLTQLELAVRRMGKALAGRHEGGR
jgi:aspartate/methionine/tyrosine aminotransferase